MESDQGLYGGPVAGTGFEPQDDGRAGFSERAGHRWSPGMARARQRAAGRAGESRVLDPAGTLVESGPSGDFSRGERVFHRKFGYGTVQAVDGDRLDIAFDKAGGKKVIASFVVPEDRAG
ncbi:MAG: hypothetical protein IH786_08060 [Proteobacteria bacterium]|nr:hypothetical protein [Pseudomonadota bacterium]